MDGDHKGLFGVAMSIGGGVESWLHLLDGILHTLIQFGTFAVIGLTVFYYVLKVRHGLRRDRREKAEGLRLKAKGTRTTGPQTTGPRTTDHG